jgi:hypothetical protein
MLVKLWILLHSNHFFFSLPATSPHPNQQIRFYKIPVVAKLRKEYNFSELMTSWISNGRFIWIVYNWCSGSGLSPDFIKSTEWIRKSKTGLKKTKKLNYFWILEVQDLWRITMHFLKDFWITRTKNFKNLTNFTWLKTIKTVQKNLPPDVQFIANY